MLTETRLVASTTGTDPRRVAWTLPLRRRADRLIGWGRAFMLATRPAGLVRYGGATLAMLAVALLRQVMFAAFAPWFLFTPAVVLVTLFLGGAAGLLATVLATFAAAYGLLEARPTGTLLPIQWLASGIFAFSTAGLVGILVVLRNALRAADAARGELAAGVAAAAARESFLNSVLASSTDCIEVLDLDGKLTFMTQGGQHVMEVSDFNLIAGCPWPDLWAGSGQKDAIAAVAAARRGEATSFVNQTTTVSGTNKWWHVAVSPMRDAAGRPDRILTVSRDITALRAAEEDLRLMNGELAHRLKNVLAVVQSVTHQTLRNAVDIKAAGADLSARLVALGTAADVLTGASWRAADLGELAHRTLAPHGELGQRIVIEGSAITLTPPVAMALALTLHELATNAAKYGALSNDDGTITLRWGVEGSDAAARFWLRWQEQDGPPVGAPTRRGFGSNLIERSLRSYFAGTTALEYRPNGLVLGLESGPDAAVWNIGEVE